MSSLRNIVASILLLAAVIAIFLPLPGESDDHLLTEEETSDATLTIFSDRDSRLIEPLIAQFEADTGIPTHLFTGSVENLIQQAVTPDVFLSDSSHAMDLLSEQQLLDPLPTYLTNGVYEQFIFETWAGVSARVQVVAYNPESLQPENLPSVLPEENSIEKMLAGDVALVNHTLVLRTLTENPSVPLAFTYREPVLTLSGVAIFAKSDSKPLAQQFISYLYFPAGQTYFRDTLFEYPVMAGIKPDERLMLLTELLPIIKEIN